jgi:hypothetical protein
MKEKYKHSREFSELNINTVHLYKNEHVVEKIYKEEPSLG